MERHRYLGGYDIASIVGVNPYASVEQVAMIKLGLLEPDKATEAMSMGLLFEHAILFRAERDLGAIESRGKFLQHPEHPFLCGTIDGIAGSTLVDAKNLNHFSMNKWDENGPAEVYLVQLNYYAALLNAIGEPVHDAKLAVVFGGQTFRIYDVPLDKELGDILISKGVEFWQRFIIGKEPLDLAAAPCSLLEKYYSKSNGTEITLEDDHIGYALREYLTLKSAIRDYETELDADKAIIQAAMASASRGIWTDGDKAITVSWGDVSKTSFDSKRFQAEQPELYKQYLKQSSYRVLRVTEKELVKKLAAQAA